ncbi:MAG TPA: M20/M25/M40 family metallo-hydrolase [Thermoanaerobaculia bacterium]|nr:M20/M25/M40 family metallo-hydrolase [Thermoanaerobaculia bacterium]
MTPDDPFTRISAEIARLGVAELAAELVCRPSHPGLPRQEEAVALALARFLREQGLAVELDEVAPGRPNLLCTLKAPRPGRHLLLCGHTDTVPLNESDAGVGFSGEVVDGRLQGRGAVDMKGALAAMAVALVALARELPAGSVTFAAVIDEEMESLGAERLVASGFAADGAVVGEPSANRVALGHKGLEWLSVRFEGRAAHGGRPEEGINALSAAARFITLVEERLAPRLAARRHPLLGAPTLNFGTLHGGDQPSTVAATAVVTLDRRLVPGESFGSVTAELLELLAEVERGLPGLTTRLRRVPGGMATLDHGPLETAPDHPLASAAARARQQVCGEAGEFTAFPAWTDGALLANFGGIPSLILGPGDLSLAHSPRESVPVAELVEAALLYAALALDFCAGEPA